MNVRKKNVKPIPLKQEPIKDLIPEFKDTTSLKELAELAKVKTQIDVVNRRRNAASEMLSGITEHFELIIEKLSGDFNEDYLNNLTDEQVEEYYTMPDGTPINIDIPMESKKAELEFKRDYLLMLVNNKKAFSDIDETLSKLDDAMAEYDKGIQEIYTETNGDVIKHVRSQLKETLEDPETDPQVKKNIEEVNNAIDWSYNLEPLIEFYSKLDPRNTISDFVHRERDIFDHFVKNCRANGIVVNYKRFNLFEARYLNERFHTYTEFLPFLVIKMFHKKKTFTRVESIFLLQLNSNLQMLFYAQDSGVKLSDEQLKERQLLVESAEKLLSLFM